MTFGVYIAGFQVIFGSKRGFFDQFCGHFMSFLWVEGLQSKLVVGDIWRIYRGFSGNIWLKKEGFWPILCSFYVIFMG